MKYREILLNQLKPLPFFDKKAISQLSEQFNLKNTTVDSYISRSLKRKDIFQLKNGLYVPADFYLKNKGNTSYLFFLANIVRKPSYVSSWTALQYYNLATEAIHTITSVTPKVTRNYKTKIGAFSYQSVKKGLFSDFSLVKNKFEFFIATPAKALFDMLYFKTRQFRNIDLKNVDLLIKELRIDIIEMDKIEQKKFYRMIKDYT
ncbi:hypothetical protein KAR28_02420 [Candidatus Parcubacteria bacterium]|nr:hypothetical protein [Candidatus Parcubacteria bacterium]